jgi:hypothetical protein
MTTTIAVRLPAATSSPRVAAAVVALVAVVALAAVGGWLAILALAGPDQHAHGSTAVAIGDEIATSFGSLTVQRADTLDGLTPADVGGMTHGVSGLVLSDSAQEAVTVLLANTSSSQVLMDPEQFRLIRGDTGESLAPTGSTMRPMTLEPGANVGASITFVVPRTGMQMSFRYRDPGSAAEITVPLGRLDQAPASAGDPHPHTP